MVVFTAWVPAEFNQKYWGLQVFFLKRNASATAPQRYRNVCYFSYLVVYIIVIRNRNAATVEHTVISYTVEPLRSIFDSETLISTVGGASKHLTA